MNNQEDQEYDYEYIEPALRTPEEVASRTIILVALSLVADGADRDLCIKWIESEGILEHVSPLEFKFFRNTSPSPNDVKEMQWRTKATLVLAWALQLIEDLPPSSQLYTQDKLWQKVPTLGNPTTEFIRNASLRPHEEIWNLYHKITKEHWKANDAEFNKREAPDGLIHGVAYERHYGINWLVNHCEQEWDNVDTDT